MADVRFLKLEVVIRQPWTQLSYRNLVSDRFGHCETSAVTETEAGVDFQLHGPNFFKNFRNRYDVITSP